jgi:hypothetical integral membrane protein (TIGR02206 family)
MKHVTMEPMSREWLICIAVIIASIILLVNLPKYAKWAKHPNYGKLLGLFLLTNLLIENWYSWSNGSWDLRANLPLHLCGISGVFSILILFWYNPIIANLVFYWGLTGGIHSLLTPEFDLGADGYLYYGYFISHGGLILTSFFLIKHRGFQPMKRSWINAFILIQAAVLIIGLFNWTTGSNYMYLSSPPIVDNPLIVGKWPWYILVFEILAILHFLLLYGLFHYKNIQERLSNLLTI